MRLAERYASLEELWQGLLQQRPHAPFLLDALGGSLSLSEAWLAMQRLRAGLAAADLPGSDQLVLVANDACTLSVPLLALMLHGRAGVLAASSHPDQARGLLQSLGVGAILGQGMPPPWWRQLAAELGVPYHDLESLPYGAKEAPPAAAPDEPALLLPTSGTSARPRWVPLTSRTLVRAALEIAESLELVCEDLCLSPMPLQHIHGISLLLASLASSSRFLHAGPFEEQRFFDLSSRFSPSWTSAAPAMLHMLLAAWPAEVRCSFSRIRTASAPLAPGLQLRIEERFGCPVLQAYGMTEAGPLISSNRLGAAGRQLGSVGRPLGVEVAIADEDGRWLESGSEGEVLIRGERVCTGYWNDPATTRKRFRNGWLRTGDRGYFDAQGFLFLTGRSSELINRGGENISPSFIEALLLSHPQVQDAAVFGLPHAVLGQQVGAAVVLQPGLKLEDLQNWASQRLTPSQFPQRWWQEDRLPRTSGGKLRRSQLQERRTQASVGPEQHALADLWEEVLGTRPSSGQANFFELGGHSLSLLRLQQRIAHHWGRNLPLEDLFRFASLEEQQRLLDRPQIDSYPLSPSQRRLVFLHELEPQSCAYHLRTPLWLEGKLDLSRLEQALSQLCQRHQALRLRTRLNPQGEVEQWDSAEVATLPAVRVVATRQQALQAAEQAAEQPFQLQHSGFRAHLFRVQDSDLHLLLLVQHHVFGDGWSTRLMLRDLAQLYRQEALAVPAPKFGDYARRAAAAQASPQARLSLEFWKSQLEDRPTPRRLYPDRAASRCSLARRRPFQLTAEEWQHLQDQARRRKVTPFVLVLAAYHELLARYGGHPQAVVGVARTHRPDLEAEACLGNFAETWVLGKPCQTDPVGAIQEQLMQAARYPMAPLDRLGPAANLCAMLAYQSYPEQATPDWGPQLSVSEFRLSGGQAKFDLTLYLWQSPQGLEGEWVCPAERFSEARLSHMQSDFLELLESLNDFQAPQLAPIPWEQRWREQVRRQPQAPALMCGEEVFSHQQLLAAAERLAGWLRGQGMGPGRRVALELPRGPALITGILGVLLSGASYLAVDPVYPEARRRQMLELARPALVLKALPEELDELADELPELERRQEAYLMATSGSGGSPRAIPIWHSHLDHYLETLPRALGLVSEDRALHTASFSFSSSVRQLLAPLTSGACVVLARSHELADPQALLGLMQQQRVSLSDWIPSYAQHVLQAWPEELTLPHWRLLVMASEPLPVALARAWNERAPQLQLWNLYGQTETCGIVCLHPVDGHEQGTWVPLGTPLPGWEAGVFDAQGQPAPPGQEGELAWHGPSLSPGALGQGPLPCWEVQGKCYYRSGDRGRWSPDGRLQFVARTDRQLKVRGVRLEPAEIEAHLLELAAVSEARVQLERDRLVAELVWAPQATPMGTSELRQHLQSRLPAAAMPHEFRSSQTLQRLPGGKLDRRRGNSVREAWSSVLRRPQADLRADDNFFESGGDSLLALELLHQLRHQGHELQLARLFQYPHLGQLEAHLLGTDSSGPGSDTWRRVTPDSLRLWSKEALEAAGLDAKVAECVVEVQLESSLRGQSTHHIESIPRYAQRLRAGKLNPSPQLRVLNETAWALLLDGDNGPGQWVAVRAMQAALDKARQHGIGVVSVRGSNHFGAAGHYAWMALQAGMVGLCTTNGPLILAPTGGTRPALGNNPLAVGIPGLEGPPVLLDIAMSVAPRGRIGWHLAQGKPLPPGWILDAQGRPSVDPADLAAGLGVPIGEHKGYGLALVLEILSGVLSGAEFGQAHLRQRLAGQSQADIGHFFLALDPGVFGSLQDFSQRLARLSEEILQVPPAEGHDEVLLPGQRELRAREENLRLGVPLSPTTLSAFHRHSRRYGLITRLQFCDAAKDEES